MTVKTTPLNSLHIENNAKMVDFAGYSMPIQYSDGILKEHLWTREKCGVFDISHMGGAWIISDDKNQQTAAAELEKIMPADITSLKHGKQQYSQLLNEQGKILDDLIVTKPKEENLSDRLYIVVNAACKDADFDYINQKLSNITIQRLDDNAQIALQGPMAEKVLSSVIPDIQDMTFMTFKVVNYEGHEVLVSRSGYTGEDGFEISLSKTIAEEFTKKVLSHEDAKLIGLGARDSLRLEAGLCLYGNDITADTTPVEANLLWSISKRRRAEGGFLGFDHIKPQIETAPSRLRVGLEIDSKAPCRAGVEIVKDGDVIGQITSGGFSPTLQKPIAMGYVTYENSKIGTNVKLLLRGKEIDAKVCKMPFVEQKYKK